MEIQIRKQHQLTLKETLAFCASSIRHRFNRSLLTLAVMVLAVAFFMYLQANQIFAKAIYNNATLQIARFRASSRLNSLLFSSCSFADFRRILAASLEEHRFDDLFQWSTEQSREYQRIDRMTLSWEYFLGHLGAGKAKALCGDKTPQCLLRHWSSLPPKEIIRQLRHLGLQAPVPEERLAEYLGALAETTQAMEQAYRQWTAFHSRLLARAGLPADADGRRVREYLGRLPEERFAALLESVTLEGVAISAQEWRDVRDYVKLQLLEAQMIERLQEPECRRKWRSQFGRGKFVRMDEKLSMLDREACRGYREGVPDGQIQSLCAYTRRKLYINALESRLGIVLEIMPSEGNARQAYLLFLAFLVCVIGITNAMLMSITERFTEIATLKCLGGTDGFILLQIVLEACAQGGVGGILGVAMGMVAAILNNLNGAGWQVLCGGCWGAFAIVAAYSLLAGVLLAMLSAIYPAIKVARMAPMEAMRVQ